MTTCGGTEAPLPDVAADGDGTGVEEVEDIILGLMLELDTGSAKIYTNRLEVPSTESPYCPSPSPAPAPCRAVIERQRNRIDRCPFSRDCALGHCRRSYYFNLIDTALNQLVDCCTTSLNITTVTRLALLLLSKKVRSPRTHCSCATT